MQFLKKRTVQGCLVGHLVDAEGRKLEVRHNPEDKFYCTWKNSMLKADTLEELNDTIVRSMGWKREWIDVIVITGSRRQFSGCPATLHIDLGYQPQHISQLADGSWVIANWSPQTDIKSERHMDNMPVDLEMPCKIGNKYCNNGDDFQIMIPYSEVNMYNLKSYQAMLTDKINALTLGLLDPVIAVRVEELPEVVADKPEDYDGE